MPHRRGTLGGGWGKCVPEAPEREDFLEGESSEGLYGLRNALRWREQRQQDPGQDLGPGWGGRL